MCLSEFTAVSIMECVCVCVCVFRAGVAFV